MPTLRLENGETIQVPEDSTPEQIQRYVDQVKNSQKTPDTFLGESGIGGVANILSGIQNSGHTFNPSDAWGILKGVYNGQKQETVDEAGQAGDQFKQGNYGEALLHAISAVPIIGHPVSHFGQNMAGGRYGAAAGDLLSLFGPKAAEMATGGIASGARVAGRELYRQHLPFTSASTPKGIVAASQAGVDRSLFSGQKSLDRIGSAREPGTILGDLESQTAPYVSGAAGQTPVNATTAFSPFIDKVEKYLDSNSASSVKAAKGMLDEAQPGLEKLSPLVKQIFAKDPQTGLPIYTPAQQIHIFKTWANGNPQTVTREFAHLGKRDATDALNSNVYNDKNAGNSAPAGGRDANTTLASGYRAAVNESAPEMAGINDQMHNLLTLKTALNQASKASPKGFDLMTKLAVGGLVGDRLGAGTLGHEFSAGAGMLGVIAIHAMKDPAVATRLGATLGKQFPAVLDALKPYMLPTATAANAGARMVGNIPLDQLFQPNQK